MHQLTLLYWNFLYELVYLLCDKTPRSKNCVLSEEFLCEIEAIFEHAFNSQ